MKIKNEKKKKVVEVKIEKRERAHYFLCRSSSISR